MALFLSSFQVVVRLFRSLWIAIAVLSEEGRLLWREVILMMWRRMAIFVSVESVTTIGNWREAGGAIVV